jgi:hypothetical protein
LRSIHDLSSTTSITIDSGNDSLEHQLTLPDLVLGSQGQSLMDRQLLTAHDPARRPTPKVYGQEGRGGLLAADRQVQIGT